MELLVAKLLALVALLVALLALRVWLVAVPARVKGSGSSSGAFGRRQEGDKVRVMAVLGSGGHTTELLKLMKRLRREAYAPIAFVVAETDKTSAEKTRIDWKPTPEDAFVVIPRSREVGQSWSSSVWTTLRSFRVCVTAVLHHRPQLVLCNGPGTCIPICAAVLLFRVLGVHTDSKIVFCESFARVQHLSLTGKLLYWFADEFVVQWPQLQRQFPKTKYLGVIC